MSSTSQQVVYRCGVCSSLFTSSTDCYTHMLLHETPDELSSENQDMKMGPSEDETLQEESGDLQADEVVVENCKTGSQTQTQSIKGTGTDEGGGKQVFVSETDASELALIKNNEGLKIAVTQEDSGPVAAVSQDSTGSVQQTEASSKKIASTLVGSQQGGNARSEETIASTATSGVAVWTESLGQVIKSSERNTNEELDIADILINIKQEKVDTELVAEQTSSQDVGNENKGTEMLRVVKIQDLQPRENGSSKKKLNRKDKIKEGSGSISGSDQKKKVVKKRKLKNGKAESTETKADINFEGDMKVVRRLRKGDDVEEAIDFENTHACKTCGKRYAILKSLKYHEKTHDLDKLHYCSVCEKGFVKPSELANHLKIHDNEDGSKKKELTDEAMHKCQYCEKSYNVLKSLKHHEKVHEIGFRYKCTLCDKAFFKPSDLERHKIRHKPLSRCYLCSKQFRDPKKLERHVRKHPEVLIDSRLTATRASKLVCKICSKKCGNFSQLCNHVRTHTKRRPFSCDVCGKCFSRVSNMKIHRKLHSGLKTHMCDICGASFADWTNRNRHLRKHQEICMNKPLAYKPRTPKVQIVEELPPAPKLKIEKEDLVSELLSSYHEFNVDVGKPASKVPKANESLQSNEVGVQVVPDVLESAKKNPAQVYVVFEDNPTVCYVLEYDQQEEAVSSITETVGQEESTILEEAVESLGEIISEGAVAEEVPAILADGAAPDVPADAEENGEAEENDVEEEALDVKPPISLLQRSIRRKIEESEKRFRCDVCGAKFKYKVSLKFHYKKHTKEGVMYCSVCNAEYFRKSRLKVHMRSHTGEKPYKCAICETSFAVAYELTVHMRRHTGQGRRKCDHCDKVFYTQRALNAHVRNLTNDKPFSCPDCGKLFKRMDQLRRHSLCHTGSMPFKCHRCSKSFRDSSNRKRHIIKTHGRQALGSLPKRRISLAKTKDHTEAAVILAELS